MTRMKIAGGWTGMLGLGSRRIGSIWRRRGSGCVDVVEAEGAFGLGDGGGEEGEAGGVGVSGGGAG